MTPDFTLLLVGGMVFAVAVLGFIGWRFGGAGRAGFWYRLWRFHSGHGFSLCVCDAELYPGQSPALGFHLYLFWLDRLYGICLFLAEGILARAHQDMLTPTPAMVAGAACHRCHRRSGGSFHRPCCRRGRLLDHGWVKGTVYYGRYSLLNCVGYGLYSCFSHLSAGS